MKYLGIFIFGVSAAVAFYFFTMFDTSVTTPGHSNSYLDIDIPSRRVENIGLLNKRQNGITAGFGGMILGAVFIVGAHLSSKPGKGLHPGS
jgi:hypothetical protein